MQGTGEGIVSLSMQSLGVSQPFFHYHCPPLRCFILIKTNPHDILISWIYYILIYGLCIFICVLYIKRVRFPHPKNQFWGFQSPYFSHDLSGTIGKRTSHHKRKCNSVTKHEQGRHCGHAWVTRCLLIHSPSLLLGEEAEHASVCGWFGDLVTVSQIQNSHMTNITHKQQIFNYHHKEHVKFDHFKTDDHCMDFYGNISNFLMDKFSQPPLEKFE